MWNIPPIAWVAIAFVIGMIIGLFLISCPIKGEKYVLSLNIGKVVDQDTTIIVPSEAKFECSSSDSHNITCSIESSEILIRTKGTPREVANVLKIDKVIIRYSQYCERENLKVNDYVEIRFKRIEQRKCSVAITITVK